ncbi:hypothetical protein PS925_06177 [Pseudomonas fluorescens]|uniref:Uncharacterized protein n=1 Tax=Pseudomonas fluorescens TaxID=294 RepID=A0A5E7VTU3_PSEFL|nr:hypothetical protein PS925_06177 [Pseudomonas fluorescens]
MGRPGDAGGLTDQRPTRCWQRWAKHYLGRNHTKSVAIALGETISGFGVAGDRFFEHLWLSAGVRHAEQQPQVIAGFTRVFGQFEQVAAAQVCLIALTFAKLIVATMSL